MNKKHRNPAGCKQIVKVPPKPLTFPTPPVIIKPSSRKLDRHTPFSLSFLYIIQQGGRSERPSALLFFHVRRVLRTILGGAPFSMENAVSLKRAAVSAFLIAAAALARVVWSVWYYRSALPLASYNALFVPLFAMAGLLCLVMSALFRQAAELKAENDLTI